MNKYLKEFTIKRDQAHRNAEMIRNRVTRLLPRASNATVESLLDEAEAHLAESHYYGRLADAVRGIEEPVSPVSPSTSQGDVVTYDTIATAYEKLQNNKLQNNKLQNNNPSAPLTLQRRGGPAPVNVDRLSQSPELKSDILTGAKYLSVVESAPAAPALHWTPPPMPPMAPATSSHTIGKFKVEGRIMVAETLMYTSYYLGNDVSEFISITGNMSTINFTRVIKTVELGERMLKCCIGDEIAGAVYGYEASLDLLSALLAVATSEGKKADIETTDDWTDFADNGL